MPSSVRRLRRQILCLWSKPEHLQMSFDAMSESEEQRMQKAIEVSHGSVGEFSRSAASQAFIKRKKSVICLFVSLMILFLVISVLLPIFWFASVPVVSPFLKKSIKFRIPVTATVEIAMLLGIMICIYLITKYSRSVQRRVSYLSSCSAEFISSAEQSESKGSVSRRSDSLISKRPTATSNIHTSSLRQILEDMPIETVGKIQELAKKYLNSGNGRSSIESSKFSASYQHHKTSVHMSNDETYKISIKVLLIGGINVGKTSIFHRILYDQFSDSYLQTIGADLGFSTLYLSNVGDGDQLSVALQIWDLGGQEQLAKAAKAYFKDSVIIIPVVDITNMDTLDSLNWWLDEISGKVYDPYMVLLLNKADLHDKVIKEDDINRITKLRNIERYEVSAKTGANVMKAFSETVAKAIVKETAKILSI